MLKLIKEYRRRKVLAQERQSSAHRAVLHNFEELRSIGFCFVLNGQADVEQYRQVTDFLAGLGIPFSGTVVELKSSFAGSAAREEFRTALEDNVVFIGKDELDWIGVPVGEELNSRIVSLFQQHFSLFLVLGPTASFTLEYLSHKINADCIAGMENSSRFPFTFVLEPDKGGFQYADYLVSLFNYLKIINRPVKEEDSL